MPRIRVVCSNCKGDGTVPRILREGEPKFLQVFPVRCECCDGSGVRFEEVKIEEPAKPKDPHVYDTGGGG